MHALSRALFSGTHVLLCLACAGRLSAQVHGYLEDELRGGPFWSQGVTIVAGLNEPMTMRLDSEADGSQRYASSGLPPGLRLGETNGVLSGAARMTGEFKAMIAVEREGYPTSFYAHRIVVEQREGGVGGVQWPAPFPSENNAVVRLRTGLGHADNYHEGGVQRMEVLDPVPPDLAWSAATGRFSGTATEGGIYHLATTLQVGGSDVAGSIAFDITPRQTDLTLSGTWQQAALGNGKAVLLNRNTRSVQVVDYSKLDSGDDAMPVDGVYPPNLHDFLHAQGYAFGKYYLLDGLLQLHVSADGLTWDDVEVPLQAATFPVHFFTPKGLVILDQSRRRAVMTDDLAVFSEVAVDDLPSNGAAVNVIEGLVAGEEFWWLYADRDRAYRSRDFVTWEYVGRSELPIARGFQLQEGFLAITREFEHPFLYRSQDGLRWELAEVVGAEEAREPIGLFHDGRDVILRAGDHVYRTSNGREFSFVRSIDFVNTRGWAVSVGDVGFGLGNQWAIARDDRRPPELLINSTAPIVDRRAVTAGEAFEIALRADREAATFHAYNLPAGLHLDETTGLISGSVGVPGSYQWHVNTSNAFGMGSPGLIQLIVHADASVNGPQLISFSQVDGGQSVDPFLIGVGLGLPDELERFRIETNTDPASLHIEAANLPPGYAIDPDTAAIVGDPIRDGDYLATFTLSSPGGRAQFTRTFIVYDHRNGTLRLDNFSDRVQVGESVPWRSSVQGGVVFDSYRAFNLPPGVTMSTDTGAFSGSFAEFGTFEVVIVGVTAEGGFSAPVRQTVVVESSGTEGSIPSEYLGFTVEEGEAGILLPTEGEETVDVFNLPQGLSFIPPASLVLDDDLGPGFYPVEYRRRNAIGRREGEFYLIVETAERAGEIRWEFQEEDRFVAGVFSSVAPIVGADRPERIMAVDLPPGLSIDETTGVISGRPEIAGSVRFYVMYFLGDAATAQMIDMVISPNAQEWNRRPESRRVVGITGLEGEWEMDFSPIEKPGLVNLTEGPEGFRYTLDWFGNSLLAGEPEVARSGQFAFVLNAGADSSELRVPYHFYERPAWGPWWSHGRHVPQVTLFQAGFEALVGRGGGFFPSPRIHAKRGSQPWELLELDLPESDPLAPLDLVATGDRYGLSHGRFLSLSSSMNNIENQFVQRVATIYRLAAGDGRFGLADRNDLLMTDNGLDFAGGPGCGGAEGRWRSVAYGTGSFVGVGDSGCIGLVETDGTHRGVESPIHSRPSQDDPHTGGQNHLNDIVFDGSAFVAVGSHGVILSSEDGENWQVERPVTTLGEDLTQIIHNGEVLVALGASRAFSRPVGEVGPWQEVTRIPDESGYTDSLEWPDGKVRGLTDGLLVPSLPHVENVFLSVENEVAIAGQPVRLAVMTLHEPDHVAVEGLPPGLAFDVDSRSIEGTPTSTGEWSALVEMQTGDEVIGQLLRFEILAPPPRLEAKTFDVVVGHPFHYTMAVPEGAFASLAWSGHSAEAEVEGETCHIRGTFHSVGLHEDELSVGSRFGMVTLPVQFRVLEPRPFITVQPESQVVSPETPAQLTVTVQGRWPFTFQWYRNGAALEDGEGVSGSNSDILTVEGESAAGTYHVVVANDLGETISQNAVLTASAATTSYAVWAEARGWPEEARGFLDDANGNGWVNLLEYALLGSGADDALLAERSVSVEREEGSSFVTFAHAADTESLRVDLESSPDLQEWESIDPAGFVVNQTETVFRVRHEIESVESGRYYRLRVELLEGETP